MATARDLCTQALKGCGVLGVGQTALYEDMNDAFVSMQQMMKQWQARRWMVPGLRTVTKVGNNQISNKIGAGQYYNVPRPNHIESAWVRIIAPGGSPGVSGDYSSDFSGDFNVYSAATGSSANDVDYPLQQIMSYENYGRIALKGLNSFPNYFFYDQAYPFGNVFIWPIPTSQYGIYLVIKDLNVVPDTLNDTMVIPPEYEECIVLNLIIRLCIMNYDRKPPDGIVALAKVALNTLKTENAQIPTLISPIGRGQFGSYNIYSDTGW